MRRKSISRAFSAGTLLVMSASMVSTLLMPSIALAGGGGPPKPVVTYPTPSTTDASVNFTALWSHDPSCTFVEVDIVDSGSGSTLWYSSNQVSNSSVVVNDTNGTFQGVLSGQKQLAYSTIYVFRIRSVNGGGETDSDLFNFTSEAAPVPEMSTWIAIVTVVTGFGLMYKFSPALRSKFDRA